MSKSTSDETDSDIDSIKCVYCDQSYNSMGAHTCHVTCTIENKANSDGSDETLIATDMDVGCFSANSTLEMKNSEASCVLCENKYDNYDSYVEHINICTANVKLPYFVCSLCHEINTQKSAHLEHLNNVHFSTKVTSVKSNVDCVDTAHNKTQGFQLNKTTPHRIGWSLEDIYQEIEPVQDKIPDSTSMSSPIKSFFAKLGNE